MLRNDTVNGKNIHFFCDYFLLSTAQLRSWMFPQEEKIIECISNSSVWEDCQCIGVCLHSHRMPRKSKSSICLGHVKTSGSRTGEPAIDRWGISPRLTQNHYQKSKENNGDLIQQFNFWSASQRSDICLTWFRIWPVSNTFWKSKFFWEEI